MEKHNPNSDHADTPKSWSELPADLLISVLERLSFANFQRAKSVCWSWNSASRQCVPRKNQIPWLILFPEEDKDNNSSNSYSLRLVNPEEKNKIYRTQHLGLELAKSFCMAIYGSWLLMRNPLRNLYILNLFTSERISLPPVESQLGTTKVERTFDDDEFRITRHDGKEYKGIISMRSPVLWIDEKTKDFLVLWVLEDSCVVYSKKGDTSWNQIPKTSGRCCDMVYKDSKLYYLSLSGCFSIFDFSGEIPQQTFQCRVRVETSVMSPTLTKLVVTVTGEVLKVEIIRRWRFETSAFRVFKIYSSGFLTEHKLITSLGDHEAMLLEQGITVLADDTNGFIRNSIYFNAGSKWIQAWITSDLFLFNLKTQKTEPVHVFDWSSVPFTRARRFFPGKHDSSELCSPLQ